MLRFCHPTPDLSWMARLSHSPPMNQLGRPLLGSLLTLLTATAMNAASFKEPVGLQLYSLRADFARDVPSTLEKVHAFGIKEVELAGTYNLTPARLHELLEAHELKAV